MKLQDSIGNEMAKRAIEVALSGNHSIVLIDTLDSNASELMEAANQLAQENGFEFKCQIVPLCPCKAYANPKHECNCSHAAIKKHLKKVAKTIQDADIIAETTAPMSYETTNGNEPDEAVIKRIKAVDNSKTNAIGGDAEYLLDYAQKDIDFDAKTIIKISRVANTITNMEGVDSIKAHHMCEAIQYQNNFANRTVEACA